MCVVDIDQLKLIMMLVGTPGPELLMKSSSESVSAIPLSFVVLPCATMPIDGLLPCVDAFLHVLCYTVISYRLHLPLNTKLWLACTVIC